MSTYNFSLPNPNPTNPGNRQLPPKSPEASDSIDSPLTMTWPIFRSLSAALFIGGLYGIAIGMCAASIIGVFIFIIGAFFGAAISVPFGFAAGVIGMALGGRKGWAIGGLAALGIPVALYGSYLACVDGLGDSGGYLLAAAGLIAIYGGAVGYWYGDRAQIPHIATGLPGQVGSARRMISLYEIPLRWRLLSMAAVLVTFLGVVWDVCRFFRGGF